MVEDSDIGPRNSALTIFSLAEFVYMSCKIFLLRGANLYLILRIITYFIMGGEIYNSISIPLLFGSFGMCLIIFVAYRAVLLFRIKRMEQFWDQTDTQVLTRGAAGKRMFTNTKIQNMKVGDIILLRARSTCPADVLIIDTAEQRHSEKVAFVNESRITGRRVLTVKTGIKNMNPVKTVKNIKSGPMEGIKKVLRRLRGKIEFDSPSPDLVNFSGKFILTNDPKVYPVTKDNILFCGSRLHTAWVYGYVLYNGLNTKIIQKNFSDQRMNGLKGFKKHVESILDRVAFAYFAIAVIEVFLLFLSLLIIFKDSTSFMQELTDKGSSKLSFYIMQSFRILGPISFPLAPVMLNMVLDIYNLVFGVKCENSTDNYQEEAPEQKQRNSIFFLDNQTTLDHKREPRNELKSINSDIKEGATERGLMSSSKNNSHSNFDSIEGSSASLRKTFTIHRPLRHSPSIALEAEDLKKSTKIINKGDRDNPVALSDTQSSSMNGLLFGRSNKLIKVTDFSVLSELGNINHVVFDKTDTLVTKKVVITNLATNHRLYEIDVGTILPMYEDVKANPAKYQNIDDYDDVMKKKDDENYSEKSQEFYNEIKGDYDPEIFEEDTNFEHVIKKIENPGYLTRRNSDDIPPEERDSSLNDSIATSVKNPFGSMDKIERKLTRLPTKRVNFKSYGSNRSIGKVTPNDMKAGSEYAVILNDIAKKEKIFKEKVLNKLNPNIIKRGSVYNRKYPTIQSVGSSDESSNSVDIEDLDGSNLDIKLNINPSKKHAQEDFLIDYYNKEDTLMEMIVCMAICHEAKIDSQGKVKCLREEEHAMLNFCKELGITFKREDSNSSIYYKIIQIKQEGKLSSILNIAGLNSFTDRNRMSIVVNDPRKGKDSYTLYVSGSPEGMAGTMLLNIHEMNNYKKLLMSFKSQGFKQLVFAKKELPRQVGQSYIKTFQLVRKSRKEQRENFEKLAMEIEKNLDFLGGIGYKYDLMEGAVDIIKNLQKAEINISVLTGDRLENTMPLIRALKISDTDFRDSSQFYSLRFKTLNDAYKEINRYMENIYEKMREENVENMVVRTTSKSEMQSLESRALRENEGDKIIDHKAHNSLSKSLLIGGSTVDLILSDPQLNQHFKFMLIFAKTVIGYSLSPFHKATIIKLLKEVKSAHILAIGDGFNDIAMLKEANVGVQLFHKDVPFVFGDIVISRIELLNNLIFSWGKTGLANYIVLILLNISVAFTANTLQFYYAKDASFSAPLYKDFNIVALLISLVMYIIPSSFMRIPYSKSLLIKFPMIYGEKRRITNNLAKIICFIFFYSIAESFWIFESTKYIISRRTTSTGVVYYQKFIEAHILLTIIILSAWRFHLCTSSNSVKKSIAVAAVPVIIIIGLIIADITSLVSSISLPIVSVLTDKNSLIASLHTILLPAFVEWAIIYTFKQEVLFKAYNIIHERFIEMDQEFFTQNGNDYLKKIIGGRVTNSVGFIRDIKNCYRRSKFLNQTLKNILSLDSNHSSLGLNSLTCSITDDNNKKRFDLYIGDTQAKKNTYYLFLIMIALLIEAFVYYISREDAVSSFSFKSPSLYLFTLLLIPLYASTLNDHKKNALLYCKIVGVTVLGLNITFRVMQLGSSDLGMKTFNRLFSGPLLMNYLLNFVYFVMNISIYCIFLIKKYFFSDIIVTPESINFLTDYFEIRTLSATIILHIFYILQKHKYDSIVKLDYLAKIRIKSEYTVSNEKLAILMPKFVLNRIDTSEMNSSLSLINRSLCC